MLALVERAGTFRPQLSGLRAIAATAVVTLHVGWEGDYGHQAVRLFFVLSGFLITGILFDARENTQSVGSCATMRAFYTRRTLRIFPAYFLLVGLTVLAIWPTPLPGLPWFLVYLGNFFIAGLSKWPDLTAHLWTLAVEEQFYLAWPLAILFTPRRLVPWVLTAVVASSILSRVITVALVGEPAIWVLPWASFDALGFGAMLAWWVRRPGFGKPRPFVLACILLTTIPVLYWFGLNSSTRTFYIAFETLWLVPLGCAILGAYLGFGGLLGRMLDNRLSLYLGRISYGIYLYHILVASVLLYGLGACGLKSLFGRPWIAVPLTMLFTTAVASGSWFFIERPALRLYERFTRQTPGREAQ